ncbi:hypothetical protein LOD99_5980 [Oopsacas minuta]|uniref:Uncharacterized protein n=1 Tax=Oopsacas minuta TaxID=111878 RepID=A0AAV7JNK2_9METZ|nr:hypothetical protein LOD99_5980 [Oopsacas minuta]
MEQNLDAKLQLIEETFAICRQDIDTKCDELHNAIEVLRQNLIMKLKLELKHARVKLVKRRKRADTINEIERVSSPRDSFRMEVESLLLRGKSDILVDKPCILQIKWNKIEWPKFNTLATITTEHAPYYRLKNRPINSFAPFSSTFLNVVPEKIAIDSETKYLAITDSEQAGVHIFTPDGQQTHIINHTSMKGPYGVFIARGKVYVTDIKTDFVYIFEFSGRLLKRFGGKGSTPHKLDNPTAICVQWEGGFEHIYVCDTNNDGVSIFNSNGACFRRLAYKLLNKPVDIKIDKSNIYVLHYAEKCVCVFDKKGTMIDKVCTNYGPSPVGDLVTPKCFDLDEEGNFYILDQASDSVKVFDRKGNWVHSLDNAGEFMECVSVTVAAGDLYILSRQGVNAVHKY